MRKVLTIGLAATLAASLGGCVTPVARPRLGTAIGDDIARFSSAYARAANNQVLFNVLQARDRLPRHYLSPSGISDTPTQRNALSLRLDPLPFNNAPGPWRGSSLGGETSVSTQPSYKVTPVEAERLVKAVYAPTPTRNFEFFWDADYPRDILIHLFVRTIRSGRCRGITADQIFKKGELLLAGSGEKEFCSISLISPPNDEAAETLTEELAARVAGAFDSPAGVARLDEVRGDSVRSYGEQPSRVQSALLPVRETKCTVHASATDPRHRAELMKIAAEKASYRYVETGAGKSLRGELRTCSGPERLALVFRDGSTSQQVTVHVLDLRSLDQMVEYLGSIVRTGGPTVNPPGWSGGPRTFQVPMFVVYASVLPRGTADADFAAALTHRGIRYRAGPPELTPCPRATGCPPRDHTATVLMILTQIYGLIPSAATLAPPSRLIVD